MLLDMQRILARGCLLTLIVGWVPVDQTPEAKEIRMSIANSKVLDRGIIQVDLSITNSSSHPVFLPQVAEYHLPFVALEKYEPEKGWIPIGPTRIAPTFSAIRLDSQKTYKIWPLYIDPHVSSEGGTTPILQGQHRLRLAYFSTERDWEAYKAYQVAQSSLPQPRPKVTGPRRPRPQYAFSEAFRIE
jgi:hypothetical protein